MQNRCRVDALRKTSIWWLLVAPGTLGSSQNSSENYLKCIFDEFGLLLALGGAVGSHQKHFLKWEFDDSRVLLALRGATRNSSKLILKEILDEFWLLLTLREQPNNIIFRFEYLMILGRSWHSWVQPKLIIINFKWMYNEVLALPGTLGSSLTSAQISLKCIFDDLVSLLARRRAAITHHELLWNENW